MAKLPLDNRPPPGIGHNGGPPIDDEEDDRPPWGRGPVGTYFAWKRAFAETRKVSPGVALRRLQRARACGLTYDEYTAHLLDTGRFLQPDDWEAIAAIIARRCVP